MTKLFTSPSAIEVISYRHLSPVKRIVRSEQSRDRSAWLFAPRCWLVAAGCSLLIGLAGCGPASSDNAASSELRASIGGPSLSKQDSSSRNDGFTPAASPLPFALVNGTGAVGGTETVPRGDTLH